MGDCRCGTISWDQGHAQVLRKYTTKSNCAVHGDHFLVYATNSKKRDEDGQAGGPTNVDERPNLIRR